MKFVDEFRNRKLVDKVAAEIRRSVDMTRSYSIMEVCGTHTMNIFRFGLKDLLPDNIRLISGPGCPVCVTPVEYIDKAIWLARLKKVIIATFGDLFRVNGSCSSLEKERARGATIKTVYSTMDALVLAKNNPDREVIFLGVGFETTSPTVAQSILIASDDKLKNYSVLCGHKTMPRALWALVEDENVNVDGFLLPGHVTSIIGTSPYEFLSKKYGKRCVVTGFEPLDIMQGILMILKQKTPAVQIQYTRIINRAGNSLARRSVNKVFEKSSSVWRGIGMIKDSGLRIRSLFGLFCAEKRFRPKVRPARENKDCICGDVIKGASTPLECKLFGTKCSPASPVGACMVSSEGTCAAYFKYRI